MSNVVNKIKQKVRSRSNSRSSMSSPTANRNSTDVPDVPRLPDRNSAVYNSSPTSRNEAYPRASLENSAFHVNRGSGGRASFDGPVSRKPLPNANGHSSTASQQRSQYEDNVPERKTSRHGAEQTYTQGHSRGRSGADYQAPVAGGIASDESSFYTADTTPNRSVRAVPSDHDDSNYAEYPNRTSSRRVSIPERLAPRPHPDAELSKPLPHVPAAHNNNYNNYNNMPRQDQNFTAASTSDPVSSSSWMSPLISTGQRQSQNYSPSPQDNEQAAKYEAIARGHLRLPEGFSLQNTERTHVYETQRPAVTQETVIQQRTEIFQEEITKDIHMHHYYTYAQPIHLVEVLPPKHFFLDPQTGVKTEIAPPFGWSLPVNMFPVSPDARHVKGWTRHYLVNDEFPYGIPETEPLPGSAAVTLKPNYVLRSV